MHSPAPLNGVWSAIATTGGEAVDGDDGMGEDAMVELARTCDAMKALVIELAEQARASRSPEPSCLEGALVDGPLLATCRGPPWPRRGTGRRDYGRER
jgi:hypothetical protein